MSGLFGVVGGGTFGTSLARAVTRAGHRAVLWSRRDPFGGDAPAGVTATRDIGDVAAADLVFVTVPSMHAEGVARALSPHLDGRHLLVHVSRGLVGDELAGVSTVLRRLTPARRVGCLAGPLSARALAMGVPGGGVVGTGFPEVADAAREALASPTLRLYDTRDVIGTEVASALVGLLALAIGYAKEMGLGPGALAILATRGTMEAARVGMSLGAEERTFSGVAGYGDVIAAVADDGRPEMELGRALARGLSLEQAGREAGAYIEGVTIARRVERHAARRGIDVPITAALAEALEGKLDPSGVLERLMTRRVRSA